MESGKRGMNPVAMTIINPRTEYSPNPVIEPVTCPPPTELNPIRLAESKMPKVLIFNKTSFSRKKTVISDSVNTRSDWTLCAV